MPRTRVREFEHQFERKRIAPEHHRADRRALVHFAQIEEGQATRDVNRTRWGAMFRMVGRNSDGGQEAANFQALPARAVRIHAAEQRLAYKKYLALDPSRYKSTSRSESRVLTAVCSDARAVPGRMFSRLPPLPAT